MNEYIINELNKSIKDLNKAKGELYEDLWAGKYIDMVIDRNNSLINLLKTIKEGIDKND